MEIGGAPKIRERGKIAGVCAATYSNLLYFTDINQKNTARMVSFRFLFGQLPPFILFAASAHKELDHFVDKQQCDGSTDADQPLIAGYLGEA
jgi:hypothetical protein